MAENATESMKDYEKELERSFRTINEGDIVSGTVIAVSEEDVTLDLNYYTQGIIKTENLSNDPDFNPKEQLQIGDEIEATVIKVDDGNGNIELSKKEANDVLAWDKLAEMMENRDGCECSHQRECTKRCCYLLRGNPCIHSGITAFYRLRGRYRQVDWKRSAGRSHQCG